MPLGGQDAKEVIEALDRNKKFLRGEIARRVNLKFSPDLRFRQDEGFDASSKIDAILNSPKVRQDLAREDDEGST
jgi:ribosome-binding factor A